jgi:hypothetical protein
MTTITRGFEMMSDRYAYDFKKCSLADGWAQIDTKQDASYYGTWANPLTLELQSYCEGDTTRTKCDTEVEFAAELKSCIEWNKEAGYWLGIDPGWPGQAITERITEAFTRMGFAEYLH